MYYDIFVENVWWCFNCGVVGWLVGCGVVDWLWCGWLVVVWLVVVCLHVCVRRRLL